MHLDEVNYLFPTGTKVEGILRQSADVEEVERRVQEYEQGTCYIQAAKFWDVVLDLRPLKNHSNLVGRYIYIYLYYVFLIYVHNI